MPGEAETAAQADFGALLSTVVPFAQEMIRKHGEFTPFCAVMSPGGQVRLIAAGDGENSADQLELLRTAVRRAHAEGEVRAAALCFNIRATRPDGGVTSAIQAQVEHANREAANVYFPYAKRFLRGYAFGQGDGIPCDPYLLVPSAAKPGVAADAGPR